MRAWRVCVGMICAFGWVAGQANSTEAQDSAALTVESVSVEKSDRDTYFKVTIRWPSEEVDEDYSEFLKKSEGHRVPRRYYGQWPADGLALIPQDGGAILVVCARQTTDTSSSGTPGFRVPRVMRSPAVFLGKLREEGTRSFLLRRPTSAGSWSYVPVSVDFSRAGRASGLDKEWLTAQADFLTDFEAPPDQSFFKFAAARLSARLGRKAGDETTNEFARWTGNANEQLYEVTTGALALQESLQLDRMRGGARDEGLRDVDVDTVKGVTVRSHPWTKMLGGKTPLIESIAGMVPDDQYYIRFKTTRSMADFLDSAEQWGGSLMGAAEAGGRDYRAKERIERQICLKSTWLSKLLGPAVIESLVFTGYDPYLREGSDFSVVFNLKAPQVFEMAVNRYIEEARRDNKDLKEDKFEYQGVAVQTFTTPDHAVRCHRARMGDFYVYSNSPAAMRRIIDTHGGRRSSLAKSLDFVYMRTLYPAGDEDEDGFIFLSDAFIRALVGPRIRIGEKRRIEALTSMEMIKNAALLYLYENPDASIPNLEDLYNRGYLEARHISAEPGDHFTWDPAAFTASSERYGRPGHLTPLVELDVDNVTAKEKSDYEQFRDQYQNYWRRYFDPVGIRIATGQTLRLSVTILPLIDNSRYAELQELIGGRAVELEPIRRDGPVVLRLAAHLNPDSQLLQMVQSIGASELARDVPPAMRKAMMWMGSRMEFWIEDSDALTAAIHGQQPSKAFDVPVVLAVEVKNPLGLAAFLTGIQTMVQVSSPNTVIFEPTEPYKGYLLTRVRPEPDSWVVQDKEDGERMRNVGLYYGKIGRMLYLSTSLPTLHRIIDAMPASQPASGATSEAAASQPATMAAAPSVKGHLSLRFDLEKAAQCRQVLMYLLTTGMWETEQQHLRNLWLLTHTVGLGPQAKASPERVLGYAIDSALGNTYRYDAPRDEIVGSTTGSLWNPTMSEELPPASPLRRLFESIRRIEVALEFTQDGLRTDLAFDRTSR